MDDCSSGTGSPDLVNDVEESRHQNQRTNENDTCFILWLPFSVWPVAESRKITGSWTVERIRGTDRSPRIRAVSDLAFSRFQTSLQMSAY